MEEKSVNEASASSLKRPGFSNCGGQGAGAPTPTPKSSLEEGEHPEKPTLSTSSLI